MRAGDWKIVRYGLKAKIELYDLAADPGETRDVSAGHADVVARLAPLLVQARTESPDFPLEIPEGGHKAAPKSKNKRTP